MPATFPAKGRSYKSIQESLKDYKKKSHMLPPDVDKHLMGAYPLIGFPDLQKLGKEVLTMFMSSNPVIYREDGVREMEHQVIEMLADIWGAKGAHGFMTAGGTESNITALWVARNRANRKEASVVIPSTAHPSFFKGCQFLGMEAISVPTKGDYTADVEKMRSAVRKDTIAIIGTCGTWPWGTIDPIQELAKIAEENSLYFHVDGAVGGLIVPFLKDAGLYDIPDFAFKVKGVCSFSADPHKLGFANTPAGSLVFKDEETLNLASWLYAVYGKRYRTLGILGSRGGNNMAMAWALFNYLGKSGYTKIAKKCMELTTKFVDGVQKIPKLSTPNKSPKVNLASVYSPSISMDAVKEKMLQRGWIFYRTDGKLMTKDNILTAWLVPRNERGLPRFFDELGKSAAEVDRA